MGINTKNRIHRENIDEIKIKDFSIGGLNPLTLIAGPCIVEDISICKEIADTTKKICEKYGLNYIFKASYDKANKTILNSYRGLGWREGLDQLSKIKEEIDVPILTDVHEINQCAEASKVADILQIPALLSKQIDLILAASKTGLPINIKKGQFTAPWEMKNVLSRLEKEGFNDVMISERGSLFGYQTLISDMRALQIMSQFKHPVIFDGSHSVHSNPTITENSDFLHRDFIGPLTRSAVANGVDGIFLEIHPTPDDAKSDSIGTFPLGSLDNLIKQIIKIDQVFQN